MKHMFLTRKVFLKKLGPQIFTGTNYVHHITLTFSRREAILATFREELVFDIAFHTLEHSYKSDSGLILSCSYDRLWSSYSESKGAFLIRISDRRSVWIMVHQRNRRIHSSHGFAGDAPWSREILDHWSWSWSPQRNAPQAFLGIHRYGIPTSIGTSPSHQFLKSETYPRVFPLRKCSGLHYYNVCIRFCSYFNFTRQRWTQYPISSTFEST